MKLIHIRGLSIFQKSDLKVKGDMAISGAITPLHFASYDFLSAERFTCGVSTLSKIFDIPKLKIMINAPPNRKKWCIIAVKQVLKERQVI